MFYGLVMAGLREQLSQILSGDHSNPHEVLGVHESGSDAAVRVIAPGAEQVQIRPVANDAVKATELVDGGFEAVLPAKELVGGYEIEIIRSGASHSSQDPYRFWPTLGELDTHLIQQGKHLRLWEVLGAYHREHQGVRGTSFSVWAPNARGVRVVGDFNSWDGRAHPMRSLGSSGVWELFVPGVDPGARYKFSLLSPAGEWVERADPMARAAEEPPKTASVVTASSYVWGDDEWLRTRSERDHLRERMSTYECHLGSWRRGEGNRVLTYRELAKQLPQYVRDMGFTHVELLPVAEHPFGGSWGYQVSSYYAPSSRFGSPDDFRALVDSCHQQGIGVIVDWVPAHFPKDEWALARFDGTALYEHSDARMAEHPDWGTLVFNWGRAEVRNFLVANALYWIEELHVDGLRVDAVASMLYLDYSRKEGEWVPNPHGGRENLDAIAFLKEMNEAVYGLESGAITIAEESTSWPAVSQPTYSGGLGFGFKWNMGWMHDTLSYFTRDPIHRRHHHNELTFGFLYAWSENFVLPLSHDEVVHGKGSLLGKMSGDRWQKFANLRSLLTWMWAHPGKKLLFMGDEIAQEREWSHDTSIDWHLVEDGAHSGLQRLVKRLNDVYEQYPALWAKDHEPDGFRWIDGSDVDNSILSFLRFDLEGSPVACVANLTPVPRNGYRVGLPRSGSWVELVNSDAAEYGGGGIGNLGTVKAGDTPWHGLPASAELTLPPLSVLLIAPQ